MNISAWVTYRDCNLQWRLFNYEIPWSRTPSQHHHTTSFVFIVLIERPLVADIKYCYFSLWASKVVIWWFGLQKQRNNWNNIKWTERLVCVSLSCQVLRGSWMLHHFTIRRIKPLYKADILFICCSALPQVFAGVISWHNQHCTALWW